MNTDNRLAAFTLLELLVVITIIVVLLALLVPSLDKALYQAELVYCATNIRAIGTMTQTYALDNHRNYPYRTGVQEFGAQGYMLAHGRDGWDDRPGLMEYINLDHFNDVLTGELNLYPDETDPASLVFSSYDLWFGFGYQGSGSMTKMGSKFSWQGTQFSYLASDRDVVRHDDGFSHNSHPDDAGIMINNVRQDAFQQGNILDETFGDPYTKARWESHDLSPPRGAVDLNFGATDGSVIRVDKAEVRDVRLTGVPEAANGTTVEWAIYLAKP